MSDKDQQQSDNNKKCKIMGCGREASTLMEFRHVIGANRFRAMYLCETCYERIDDQISYLDGLD